MSKADIRAHRRGNVGQFVRTGKFADSNAALQQMGFDYVTLDLQGYTMRGLRVK